MDISKFQGGIAIASGDVQSIKNISVNAESVMTIENKTSFQRLKDRNLAMMYLGGFANRHQIEFLKKVISDNPNVKYQHLWVADENFGKSSNYNRFSLGYKLQKQG